VYDTASGSFLPVSSIANPGAGAAAVRLNDGRVLAVGGFNGVNAVNAAMTFDAATGLWTPLDAPMIVRRANPMVTVLSDGRVLIAGGNGDAGLETSAEIFDPATATFSVTGSMSVARVGTATLLQNGTVLMTGGATADGAASAAADIFDPASGTFAPTGAMAIARRGHQASRLPDGRVLITGGYDATAAAIAGAEIFDPASGAFTAAGSMLAPRADHRAVSLASGDVLIIGGRNTTGAVAGAEIYAAASGGFTPVADLNEPRWSASAAVLNDGRVLVAGGHGAAGALVSAELLTDPPPAPVKATTTLTITPITRQYSDRESMTATVTPATAAYSVTFKMGTQVLATAPVVAGVATANPQLLGSIGLGARIITAEFHAAPNYQVPSPTKPMMVLREDAQVPATPPRTVNTGCSTCRTTTVHLEATVNDISYASPATDPDGGDIGLATASFVNRATGVTIATVPVIADPTDHRTGKASYDWPVNLGTSSSQTFTIGVIVGAEYIRNNTADNMNITVVRR
jgi:hypothetical protein